MKLMTKEIEKKLLKTETGSTLGNMDAEVIVKYFNPCGAGTWLITEGEKLEDGDWLLHGYCHIFEWEWGAVLLSELETPSARRTGSELSAISGAKAARFRTSRLDSGK